MYPRTLQLTELLKHKSFFLFGPRSTGKSTLIREQLKNAKVYDLLRPTTYQKLLKHPEVIEQEYSAEEFIVIDEIQKLPELLDEVHRLIEEKNITFLLTGSSARKLKHKGVNLLAGRAWSTYLHPLTYKEIDDFDLVKYLNVGGLPQVYTSELPLEELESYVATYLQEEIKSEAVTRNIGAFGEFLDIIALTNGEEINYESLASDCQVSPSTLKSYIQILEDTMIGFTLAAYKKTKKRKAISRGKHYLFDIGVTNYLANRSAIKLKSREFGKTFESFIINEVKAFVNYKRTKNRLYYWRSTSKQEVDLIVDDQLAIEIKGTDFVQSKHLKGLKAIAEEEIFERLIVVSTDQTKRVIDGKYEVWPWAEFLKALYQGDLITATRNQTSFG